MADARTGGWQTLKVRASGQGLRWQRIETRRRGSLEAYGLVHVTANTVDISVVTSQGGGCVCVQNTGDRGKGEQGGPGRPPGLTQWWIPRPRGVDSDAGQPRENTNKRKNECFLLLDPGDVASAYYLCVRVCTCCEYAYTCLLWERGGPMAFIRGLKGPLIPEELRNAL